MKREEGGGSGMGSTTMTEASAGKEGAKRTMSGIHIGRNHSVRQREILFNWSLCKSFGGGGRNPSPKSEP